MDVAALLTEGFSRVSPSARRTLDGLDDAALTWRADPAANTIAWLVWHLARQQNEQVAQLASQKSSWTDDVWVSSSFSAGTAKPGMLIPQQVKNDPSTFVGSMARSEGGMVWSTF